MAPASPGSPGSGRRGASIRHMYRDDTCAVCGESLPPDHFYCREHAADVDDRLSEIGTLLPRVAADVSRLAELVGGIAGETWDYVAEDEPDDPVWPPVPEIALRADPEHVEVDVDSEPGLVRVRLGVPLADLLDALARGFDGDLADRFPAACRDTEGANATH